MNYLIHSRHFFIYEKGEFFTVQEQIKISLLYDADVTAAKKNVQSLSDLLKDISTNTKIGIDGGPLSQAADSARHLQTALQDAINVDTGKLNLNKLNQSLKKSHTDIRTIVTDLQSIGGQGSQAFLKLAQAVASAEAPMFRVSDKLKEFGQSMLNAARWKMAQGALNAMSGSISAAVSHAEHLDKALTDIQIVSKMSNAQMAEFANQASKAAKELNTTSTEYAQASLIFYQQGLTGDAVTERADTVVKMAQATGQSTQTISNQLTAIWNNFDNGTKSLEYYADAIVKLGASTAASSEEIASGVEKFASIADTVGLSFEYATAGLATVVAETRQSADTVGTAFKTMFARIQGLKLGDSLEDGVDLNKYSAALEAVGVNVLDSNGELRKMDNILDDLGEKWDMLGDAQKAALAQTVAGVRQYTQMVSLMDNWDTVKENIQIAADSTGELNEQTKIWQNSIEGAQKRLQSSKDALSESLINKDDLVFYNNALASIVDTITKVIDSMGGIIPLVTTLAGLFAQTLIPAAINGFGRIKDNIKILTGSAAEEIKKMQNEVASELQNLSKSDNAVDSDKKQALLLEDLINKKKLLAVASKNMTEAERVEAENALRIYEEQILKAGELYKQQELIAKQKNEAGKKVTNFDRINQIRKKSDDKILTEEVKTKYGDLSEEQLQKELEKTQKRKQEVGVSGKAPKDIENRTFDKFINPDTGQDRNYDVDIVKEVEEERKKELKTVTELEQAIQKLIKTKKRESEIKENSKDLYIGIGEGPVVNQALEDATSKIENVKSKGDAEKGISLGLEEGVLDSWEKTSNVISQSYEQVTKFREGSIQLNTSSKELSAQYEKVKKASEAVFEAKTPKQRKKLQQDLNKEVEKLRDTYKKVKSSAESTGKSLGVLGDEGIKSGKEIEEALDKDNVDIEKLGNAINEVTNEIKGAEEAASTSGSAMEILADNTAEAFKEVNPDFPVDQVDIFTQSCKEGSQKAVELAQSQLQIQQSSEKANNGLQRGSKIFQKFFGALGQGYAAVMGVKGAIDQITDAMKNGASGSEMFSTVLSSLIMVMPAVIALSKALAAAKDKEALATLRQTIATQKAAAAEGGKTIVTWGLAAAEAVLKAIQEHGVIVGLAVGAAAVAAIATYAALTSQTKELTKAEIERNKASKESAEAVSEQTDKWIEQTHIMDTLIAKYEELNAAQKDTTQIMQDISDATGELIKSYQDMINSMPDLDTVTKTQLEGLIEQLDAANAAGDEARIKTLKTQIDKIIAEAGTEVAAAGFEATKKELSVAAKNKGEVDFGGAGGHESQAVDIMKKVFDKKGLKSNKDSDDFWFDMSEDPQEFVKQYEALKEAEQEIVDTFGEKWVEDSGATEELREFLSSQKELYEETLKYQELYEKVNLTNIEFTLGTSPQEAAKDLDSYQAYLKEFQDKAAEEAEKLGLDAEMAKKAAKEYVEGMQIFGDLPRLNKIFETYYKGNQTLKKELTELYESLNEGERKLFMALDFSKIHSAEEAQMKMMISSVNTAVDKINASIKSLESVDIKKNMGFDDWMQIADMIEWGKNGIIEFNEFLAMNRDEQQAYIDNMVTNQMYAAKWGIEEELASLESEHDQRQADREAAQEEIKRIDEEIAGKQEKYQQLEASYNSMIKNAATNLTTAQKELETFQNETMLSITDPMQRSYELKQYQNAVDEAQKIYDNTIESKKSVLSSGLVDTTQLQEQKAEQQNIIDSADEDDAEEESARKKLAVYEKQIAERNITRVGLDVGEVEDLADALKETYKNLEDDDVALKEIAKDQARFDRAVQSATDNLDDWKEALQTAAKTGTMSSDTLQEMRDAYGDLLDINGDVLSQSFIKNSENLELMEKALKGDEEAYQSLLNAAREEIELKYNLDENEQFQTALTNVQNQIQAINMEGLEVGADLNIDGFLDKLTEMVKASGMTADEATDYLSSMGIDATVVETEPVKNVIAYEGEPVPTEGVSLGDNVNGPLDNILHGWTYNKTPVEGETKVGTALEVKSAKKSSGGNVKYQHSSPAQSPKKSSGGGGGSKDKKPAKKSEIKERYKPITDKIEALTDALSDANKEEDRLFGENRLKNLEKQNALIEDQIKLYEQKYAEAQSYLKIDQQDLAQSAANLKTGIGLIFDEATGSVSNYDEFMEAVWNQYSSLSGEAQENYKEQIDDFKKSLSTYDGTVKTLRDTENTIQDLHNQWQDKNFEQITLKAELQIKADDRQLAILDYYMGKIEDDVYSAAEAIGYLSEKIKTNEDKMATNKQEVKELTEAFEKGEISEAAYKERLEQLESDTISLLQSQKELEEQMKNYYGEVLRKASEEIDKYTQKMVHQVAVLDHYKNLLEITGQGQDYKKLDLILKGREKILADEAAVAKAEYEMFKQQEEEARQRMEAAINDPEAFETYKKQWEDAVEVTQEAQEKMLSSMEEWAQAMRDTLENTLEDLKDTLSKSLSGGLGLDQMTLGLDRAESLQEEYLTTTNKIYETNKLMNQAQLEMNKSTNAQSKQRLKDFMRETQQLQDQAKVSSFELQVQQAKYELLLAEIELRDAQNAKSTVRLQRDNEGNFGYVYTADQSQIADAQQKYEDAQNNLYNIGLEGANNYARKYQETFAEMLDELSRINIEYANDEEERDRQIALAKEYFFQRLNDLSNLHDIAVKSHVAIENEAWSTALFNEMASLDKAQQAVNEYLTDSGNAINNYQNEINANGLSLPFDNLKTSVEEAKTASEDLKTTLLGDEENQGIIELLEEAADKAKEQVDKWVNHRNAVGDVVKEYEKLIQDIEKLLEKNPVNLTTNHHTNYTYSGNPAAQDSSSSGSGGGDGTTNSPGNTVPGSWHAIEAGSVTTSHLTRQREMGTTIYTRRDINGELYVQDSEGDPNIWYKKRDLTVKQSVLGDYIYTVAKKAKKYKMEFYDTGGYTGEWGPEGKLAALHEKEIVLNKSDTANFLASLDILHDIIKTIDVQSLNHRLSKSISSPKYYDSHDKNIQQQVTIEANFPSVENRSEIEDAFNNLINQASQYAGRR